MGAFSAQTAIGAGPDEVMLALTDPGQIASWSPVPFELQSLEGGRDRLESGSRARIAGRLAGKELEFQVEVHEAEGGRLHLTAIGPFVDLDVGYDVESLDDFSHVTAAVAVSGKGVMGRFVAKAVEGLLAGGALDHALGRIAAGVEDSAATGLALAA
jgi:polyketide cyclase/dehydrase/lipid transport protein